VHLRNVPVSVRTCRRRFSFFNPAIAQSHKTPSETAARASQLKESSQTANLQFEFELWHLLMSAATLLLRGSADRCAR